MFRKTPAARSKARHARVLAPVAGLDDPACSGPAPRNRREAVDAVLRNITPAEIGGAFSPDEVEELLDESVAPEDLSRFSYGVQPANL